MVVPFAYALGIVAMLLVREAYLVLPGSGDLRLALAGIVAMALPALVAAVANATKAPRRQRMLERLSAALLPVCFCALLGPLTWADLAEQWSRGSHLAQLMISIAPLLLGESLRIAVETRGEVAKDDPIGPGPVLRSRFAFVGLFTMPWIALAAIGDILAPFRGAYAFVIGTGIGLTIGTLAFVLLIATALPFAFRLALGLSMRLPEPIGSHLRATAAALGFRRDAVLFLDSGMRTVNALLIGPLPWPRYLVLTDGLMATLDAHALRGVVAHEVGHAQAGHPAMLLALFVAAPLLLANLGNQVSPEILAGPWGLGTGVLLALLAWRGLRKVSHRFEHEADVLSAIALGGAEPCIQALQRVGEVVHGEPERATMLHPSEHSRIETLRRFAEEPEFRAKFALRGLRLRRCIAGAMFLAVIAGAISWHRSWPWESAALAFHNGQLVEAKRRMDAVGSDVPAGQWEWWQQLREELDAAIAIAGNGGDWTSIQPQLASEGWRRGVAILVKEGPAAARPWIALSTEDDERSPLRRSVLLYCEAAVDADLERMEQVADHVRRLRPPTELAPVFGG